MRKGFSNSTKLIFFTAVFFAFLITILSYQKLNTAENNSVVLSSAIFQGGYTQYAAYNETFIDMNHYLKTFPTANYALYKVNDLGYFFLENKPDIIKSALRNGERWESYLTPHMAKYVKKGTNVLDIGAHIGTHTLYLSKLLDGTGTVWAFEPQAKIFAELNANLLLNQAKNVKTLRYAVGDKDGTIEMNPADIGNEGGTKVGKGGDKAHQVKIDSLNIKNVSFIKLDVESYEENVLNGAKETIAENKPVILCEIQGSNPFASASKQTQLKILHTIAMLKSFGYNVTKLHSEDYLAVPI